MEFHPDDQPHWRDARLHRRGGFTPHVEPTDPPRPYLWAIIAIGAIALAVAAVVFNLLIAR